MQQQERDQKVEEILRNALQPTMLELTNESHLHAGHPGAASGLSHYALSIQSNCFHGLSRIQCHRLIYQALGSLMQTDIHAIRINIKNK